MAGERIITVRASGGTNIAPDRLQFVLGVSLTRSDPGEALMALAERLNLLGDVLDQAEIPAAGRRTTELNIQPDWNRRGDAGGAPEHRGSASVTVIVSEFAAAAHLVAAAGAEIGDSLTVSGLQWIISDPTSARVEARRTAVEAATAAAQQLAADAGLELGSIRSITEPPDSSGARNVKFAARAAGAEPQRRAAPRLDSGDSIETVTVEMTWDLTDLPPQG